jgi:hydroxymethylbilane synthase
MKIIIGSRGSQLALWQSNWVKDRLATPGYEVESRIIKTTGDKLRDVPLAQSGTKGLFIKEIEEALAGGTVDVAVHSMKDLPTDQPADLVIAAVPEREDARDVLISRDGQRFVDLPAGARVGSSSVRRQAQLRSLRGDLSVVPLRGNLDTRLKKLDRGDCDALVVAAAGVHRLGLRGRITEYFSPEAMCPAVGQGALAIEIRQGDERTERAVRLLDHVPTHQAVRAERALLRYLGGGCQVPIAAHAVATGGQLNLVAIVASPDGSVMKRAAAEGTIEDPEGLGARVAAHLFEQGARAILASK